ncbi:MAG: hypothetical protein QOF89_5272 [Acidobacteriota bacterium]|nr:hypothetical protein [Acidobacteriota bacterium]
MAESGSTPAAQQAPQAVRPQGNPVQGNPVSGNPIVAVLSAWLVPGLGHVYLKRRLRGLAFFVLVMTSILIGCKLEGKLYMVERGQPLTYLATLGSMGMGFPYFVLRYWLHYQGNVIGAGFEYGTAFLLTAGLMNLLLVLDAWDIVRGKKE